MLLALLALTLAVDEPAPAEDFEPQATVWLQPLGLILAPMPFDSGVQAYYLSAGATALLPKGLELALEVGGYEANWVAAGPDRETMVKRGLMLAFGPLFHTGDRAFSGFFVEPKLVLEVAGGSFRDSALPARDLGLMISAQLGATAGWQLRWRRLYLALSIGASAGVGNHPGLTIGPLGAGFAPRPSLGFQWGLDVNLVRIGLAL